MMNLLLFTATLRFSPFYASLCGLWHWLDAGHDLLFLLCVEASPSMHYQKQGKNRQETAEMISIFGRDKEVRIG